MRIRTPVTYPGMVALRTVFLGPTDTEGSRIMVELMNGGSLPEDRRVEFYPVDHSLDPDANHAAAAQHYANSQKSHGRWAEDIRLMQASTTDGYVFVPYWPPEE
jgi:hypothetical protein